MDNYRSLDTLNLVCAAAHLTLAIVAAVADARSFPVYESAIVYVENSTGAWSLEPRTPSVLIDLNFNFLVASFFGITALFAAGNRFLWRKFYLDGIRACRNPLRWVEYTLSAPPMAILIAYFSGVINAVQLVFVIGLTVTTMTFGLLAEESNRPDGDTWQRPLLPRLLPHAQGYIPQAFLWAGVLYKFADTGSREHVTEDGQTQKMPSWVWAIVVSEVLLFLSFAGVQLAVIVSSPSRYVAGEIAYQALSLTSKMLLGILMLVNVLYAANM